MALSAEEIAEGVAKGEIKLLTSKDVVKMIQTSRGTLDRWVANPEAVDPPFPQPTFVLGKSRRWTPDQITEWLEGCVLKAQDKNK